MLSKEAQIKKSRALLKKLKTQLDAKSVELRKTRDSNLSSWNSYGSELCAAQLERSEQVLVEELNGIRGKMILLQNFINGKVVVTDGISVRARMEAIDAKIKSLLEQKEAVLEDMKKYDLLAALLSE